MNSSPDKKATTGPFSSPNIKSPSDTPAAQQTTLGGMPPKKGPEEIFKANSPEGRGRAPDAAGM